MTESEFTQYIAQKFAQASREEKEEILFGLMVWAPDIIRSLDKYPYPVILDYPPETPRYRVIWVSKRELFLTAHFLLCSAVPLTRKLPSNWKSFFE